MLLPSRVAVDAYREIEAASPGATRGLPDIHDLELVIEELLWASTLAEEGRPCRPRALYGEPHPLHSFAEHQPFGRHDLRKLSPAHGASGYLTWHVEKVGPRLTGIAPKFGVHPGGLILCAPAPMALDVLWDGERLVTSRAGSTYFRSTCKLPTLQSGLGELEPIFGGDFHLVLLAATVQAMLDDAHGGSIWIVGRGVKPKIDKMVEIRPGAEGMTNDDSFSRASIGHLAGIDGAVVIDASLRVLGIGAFVKAKALKLKQRQAEGDLREVPSTVLGGGRHRSALSFCKANAPAAAIVVSTDGRITLAWCAGQEATPNSAEVVALGRPLR